MRTTFFITALFVLGSVAHGGFELRNVATLPKGECADKVVADTGEVPAGLTIAKNASGEQSAIAQSGSAIPTLEEREASIAAREEACRKVEAANKAEELRLMKFRQELIDYRYYLEKITPKNATQKPVETPKETIVYPQQSRTYCSGGKCYTY